MLKYAGRYSQLQKIVENLGFEGEWKNAGVPMHPTFREKNGALLNFWPTTGTINGQGRNHEVLTKNLRCYFEGNNFVVRKVKGKETFFPA